MSEHDRNAPIDTETATQLETLIDDPGETGDASETAQALDLGHFKLIRELGRGGMGRVFLARQLEPVERDVALKLIRNRVVNRTTLARFEVERQILAQMQHPAIAQVHDAGTTPQGYPYFAMEYVDGRPLDRYLEQHRLPLKARIDLFMRICQGVQHAHQRGIVHRDLKPANILVTTIDGVPSPKIIDFGIATASRRDEEDSERTRDVIGTPEYMAPEQFADGDGLIDPRSDVYSLGVILYEMLVDHPPIERGRLRSGDSTRPTWIEATGGRKPAAPSTKLSQISDEREAIARRRDMRYRELLRSLRGDLDAVVLKALSYERGERYDSPAEMADDLERYLSCRPLKARSPTRRYVAGKFLRRNAVALGSASAVLLALLAGLAAATLGMLEAQRQYERAEERQRDLEQVSAFQRSMLADIDARAMGSGILEVLREQLVEAGGESETIDPALLDHISARANAPDLARAVIDRHMLERARESIEADFADRPLLQADLYDAIFQVYKGIGLNPPQTAVAERMIELRSGRLGDDHLDVLQARRRLGGALFRNADYAAARTQLEGVVDALESRSHGARSDEALKLLLATRDTLALTLVDLGEREQAVRVARHNLDQAIEFDVLDEEELLGLHGSVGYVLARSGQVEEALEHFRRQAEGMRRLLPEDDPRLTGPLSNLSAALASTGQLEEALEISREMLSIHEQVHGRRHPNTLRVMVNVGNMLSHLDRVDEAIAIYRTHNAASREINGPDHPNTLRGMLNLASAMIRIERPEDALETVRTVAERRRSLLGPDHLDTLMAEELHANALIDMDRHDEALPIIEHVHRTRREILGAEHPLTAAGAWWLGRARLGSGDAAGAVEPLQAAVESNLERRGADHGATLTMAMHLFDALRQSGDAPAAQAVREQYLMELERSDPGSLDEDRRELREEWLAIRGG